MSLMVNTVLQKYEKLDVLELRNIVGGSSKDVANNLKNMRLNVGISQQTLANAIYVDVTTISSYERGITIPTLDIMIQLADYFETTIDEIVGHNIV